MAKDMCGTYIFTETIWKTDWENSQHLAKMGSQGYPARVSESNQSPRYYTHEQYMQYRGLISTAQGLVIAYTRVSSPGQKKDLAIQKEALRAYYQERGQLHTCD